MDRTADQLAAALSDRYRLERKLGEGGMASVYLARDLKHDRPVAIKTLKPELASTIGAERFLAEIRTTAKLSHPRILQLIDSGNVGGVLYYVMPFVDGESLRARMDRERQLGLDAAIDITQQIADALQHAHDRGIIHRDIKPENILLDEPHVLVADFGIARAISAAGDTRLTETGIAVGTPTYMSPEQSTGEREIDARSDVYSLASVTYEMLVGEPPFVAPNAQALIARRLTETPRPVRATRDAIPSAVDAVIAKALARAPADRHATVDEFASGLRAAANSIGATPSKRRPMAVAGPALVAIAALAAAGVFAMRASNGRATATAAAPQPRIAVLPFENLGRADDEAFTAGITEEITSRLAGISALKVVSRTSARRFARSTASMKEVGKALNADYVLEGTVRMDRASGDTGMARVTPQLIRVADDSHVWEQVFDASLVPGAIFRVQGEIAAKVAAAMNATLLDREKGRLTRASTNDSAAYRLYQLGRFQWEKRTPESLSLAKGFFRQAIDRDPMFARAYAGLGDATFIRASIVNPDSGYSDAQLAIAALRRAVALDTNLAEGHAGLGYVLAFADRNWTGADSALRRAITLDPTYAPARYWYGQLLAVVGSKDEGLAQVREAVSLDPLSAVAQFNLSAIAASMGRYDEAEVAGNRSVELQPTYALPYWGMSIGFAQKGERRRAEEALRRFVTLSGEGARVDDELIRNVVTSMAIGRDTTRSISRLLQTGSLRGHAIAAWMFTLTGQRDSAFARLRQAIAVHSLSVVPGLGNTERFLKDDPRWLELLKSVGLERR